MGSSWCCIVACTHLRNGTDCQTAIFVAPLLITSGPLRYEAVLDSCGTSPVELVTVHAHCHWCYPTQSHYPDTESISPCPILIMPSAGLGS